MTDFEDYKNTGAANLAAPPTGAPEGMARTDVNNVLREVMAVTRRDWEGTASGGGPWRNVSDAFAVTHGGGLTVKIAAVNQTALFPLGRKVKMVHASSPDAYGFVSLVAMSGSDTIVTVEDFDGGVEVQSDCDGILIFNAFGGTAEHGLGRAAFEAGVNGAVVPGDNTAAAINAAVVTAIAVDGGYVLLEAKTYNIEAPITIESGMKIIGMGTQNTILKLDPTTSVSVFTATATDRINIEMRDFSIDGNATLQATGHGIEVTVSLANVWLDNIEIKLVKEAGITILPSTGRKITRFKMTNCHISTCGSHCFQLEDEATGAAENSDILINNCSFTLPQRDAGVLKACMRISGHANISNVFMDPGNLGSFPIGITFLLAATGDGDPPGAFQNVLTNFVIREDSGLGSVGNTFGVVISGSNVSVTNGVVELAGASAKPLQVQARAGVGLPAPGSSVSNCTFIGGLRCEVTVSAPRTRIYGCRFSGQSSVGLLVNAADSMIRDCLFDFQGADGLTLGSDSDRTSIQGNHFKNCPGDGVQVSGAANGTLISGNSFLDITGNAIDVLDVTTLNTSIVHNYFNSTGTDIVDAGTGTNIHLLATLGQAPLNTWTTTNVTTDRSINANGADAEIGDGLTTLIEDLKTLGILG